MAREKQRKAQHSDPIHEKTPSSCSMEALISIDGRGQIVLPKDVRNKAGIQAGDKLAVVTCESDGEICCLLLLKADAVATTIKGLLGPTMNEILNKS